MTITPMPASKSTPSSLQPSLTSTYTRLGETVPHVPHAISVSLPTWKDVVGYEEGEKRVVDAMKTGYPRFFIHRSIQQLANICEKKFGNGSNERCFLFPNATFANACRDYVKRLATQQVSNGATDPTSEKGPSVRLVQYIIQPPSTPAAGATQNLQKPQFTLPASDVEDIPSFVELHIVFVPPDLYAIAKSFWQHTGNGISSRRAERCLLMLGVSINGATNGVSSTPEPAKASGADTALASKPVSKPASRYAAKHLQKGSASLQSWSPPVSTPPLQNGNGVHSLNGDGPAGDAITSDQAAYLEERYGRSLPLSSATTAKRALRRRIAGVLIRDVEQGSQLPQLGAQELGEDISKLKDKGTLDALVGTSSRGGGDVAGGGLTENDVYLFATGMCAIWHAHQMAMGARAKAEGTDKVGKSVCFGFPYTDTLKILQKWGPGCHFLGHGLDSDIDELTKILADSTNNPSTPPILALFCEFPSNPLLRSPNLPLIRSLADQYGFIIVVDETIANFGNVDVLLYADVVVSSLTKVFSGEMNVMGGSLVLNPRTKYYRQLKAWLAENHKDDDTYYWGEDAVYMERNSRDFQSRVDAINKNTEDLAEYLRERSEAFYLSQQASSSPAVDRAVNGNGIIEATTNGLRKFAIKEVFYPKWVTRENYDACRIRSGGRARYEGGYGGLFSITFTSEEAAAIFFDTLRCEKGPSLGTNFTLACPYTVLAHYTEFDWAASWGVPKNLVRVSVGLEDVDILLAWFQEAVSAVENSL